jgi:hypothetical protein
MCKCTPEIRTPFCGKPGCEFPVKPTAEGEPKATISLVPYSNTKVPYCCPVCLGNGMVANGFYNQVGGLWSTSDATPEKCRSCNGTGVVWGE